MAMDWSARRQFLYALLVILAILGAGVAVWFGFFYHAPSCADGIQNRDEGGIDCGGTSCTAICEAPNVAVIWSRSVEVAPGVFHAVALVRNPLTDAGADDIPYAMRLFDAKNILIAERKGVISLAPGEVAPIFEANVITGSRIPARTFVSLGAGTWEKMTRHDDPIHVGSPDLDQSALRLTATLENTTALPVGRTTVTALLYDAEGILVASSQTVVDGMGPRATKQVVFTWQEPFTAPVVQVDVVPRVVASPPKN
jgi:hypothetical protein